MKILLAEDDIRLGELIVHMLGKKAGCVTDWVTTGEEAYDYALASSYDVVMLDWMMPEGDGVTICRRLRKAGYGGAILMLTAKDALENRVEGLGAGADDYLVKPFELDELIARLRALTRRNFAPIMEEVVKLGELTLNRASHTVELQQQHIQLTPREFQVLDLLVTNKGRVLTRELILDRIWGLDTDVTLKVIDATVKLTRRKLDLAGRKELIQSVRGIGYKIDA
ncbi:DNA-binding response OmpR family regulator [Paenibacillus phyllosphaerae]|uniref:DNA-binding response OmpR family regulator n=1 Tax=Paenibacillus phyllosphaerae TaxID=274593 RepID=A0A7W5B461_9BACL|nr:response regulator transcription factor [Paenibacillus phyllosphaerae]MBB3113844.1 DNA-binding response OmpR family regulator [Paenibacillus phyllosphaerae]